MKTIKIIKFISAICVFGIATFALPANIFAQHFGHGGGGFHGGGGGGFHAAPAPAARPFSGGFNGGARNVGGHTFSAPPAARGGRIFGGSSFRFRDHAYHNVYGGRPYFYHPYHPYIWGPRWHPFGFFAATLAADAFYFSLAGQPYYYDDGVYYEPYGNGYTVVAPPVGAVVNYLPDGYITVEVDGGVYYYYGGAFYVDQGNSFRVVPAPVGAIVSEIPEGAREQVINGQSYLLYNNTYYEPISQNGQDAYQVVQVN